MLLYSYKIYKFKIYIKIDKIYKIYKIEIYKIYKY